MSTGTLGTVIAASVDPSDVEIFYSYAKTRDVIGSELIKLNSADVLFKTNNPNRDPNNSFETYSGVYNLKLPVANFSAVGFYTIVIKPVEIRTTITDVGVLSAFPDIKGVIFDTAAVPASFVTKFENNGLVGCRIEYLNTNASADAKINNFFRVITSNNRAEPVNQNLTNTNQKAIRYRFNDNSTLVFCTVSPSSATNVTPNALPFIGQPNQSVIITNSFFNPVVLEVQIVNYDIESLAVGLFGNSSKSLSDGIYSIYNFDNQIYKQYNLFEIQDRFTGKPLFEIREGRTNIDFTKNFNTITNI